jgi:MOSC domain-containing protein YiiM
MLAEVEVLALLSGKAAPLGDSGEDSGINKQVLSGKVQVTEFGLLGDEQADLHAHGGPEKALHHYAREHYANWRDELRPVPVALDAPGAFGENISTFGMTEANVCVGDVYTFGSALIQVSQARQPCWKLNLRFNNKRMAREVQRTGRTGWYYRVLRTGTAETGDMLRLLERPHPDWSLTRMLHVLYVDMLNMDALREIAALKYLTPNWKKMAQRRIENGCVENWAPRLRDAPGESDEKA